MKTTAEQIMAAATAKAEKLGVLLPVEKPRRGDRKIIKGKWHEWRGMWVADDHKVSTADGCAFLSYYI